MFLRKLGKRGVAMTEYAILLAFVAAIGVAFISDGGLGKSIEGAVAKVVAMLDGTNARNDLLGDLKLALGSLDDLTGSNQNDRKDRLHSDILNIEANSEYEIQIDLSKITLPDGHALEVGFFTTDSSGQKNGNAVDSGGIKLNTEVSKEGMYTTSIDGNMATISFKTGENSSLFGMNFKTKDNNSYITTNTEIKDSLNNAVSLYKKQYVEML